VESAGAGYLTLFVGQRVTVEYKESDGNDESVWLFGTAEDGERGWFPAYAIEEERPVPSPKVFEEALRKAQTFKAQHNGHTSRVGQVVVAPGLLTAPLGGDGPRSHPDAQPWRNHQRALSDRPFVDFSTRLIISATPPAEMPPVPLDQAIAEASEVGVELIGACAPAGTPWEYPLCNKEKTSFVGFLKSGFSRESLQGFLWKVMKETEWLRPCPYGLPIQRRTAWMTTGGCTCPCKFGTVEVDPVPFPPWMREIMEVCMPLCGLADPATWPNSCMADCFGNGEEGLPWQSDEDGLFNARLNHTRVITFSLGQERGLELRPTHARAEGDPNYSDADTCRIQLRSGDLCTMEGMTQRQFKHRVPRGGRYARARVSLTWRWVVCHNPRKCSLR
jgi:alkylated DNA repair dioxygenase AlkB